MNCEKSYPYGTDKKVLEVRGKSRKVANFDIFDLVDTLEVDGVADDLM